MLSNCNNLDQYMTHYGGLLASAAERAFEPLHTPPGDEPVKLGNGGRELFEAQAHTVAGAMQELRAVARFFDDRPGREVHVSRPRSSHGGLSASPVGFQHEFVDRQFFGGWLSQVDDPGYVGVIAVES